MLRLVLSLALLLPLAANAQGRPARGQGRRGGPPPTADSARPSRAQMEERIRARFAEHLKTQLGLTDEQMTQVRDISLRYAERRRLLLDQERAIRMSLREWIVAGDSSRQAEVALQLDRMIASQRQRIDLLDQEQKDLAAVLTPLQRAAYMGMEEQFRQAVDGMRGGRPGPQGGPLPGGAGGTAPRRGPPDVPSADGILPGPA